MGSRGLQQIRILIEPAEITGSFQYPDGFAVQILVPVYSIGFIQVKEQSPLRWKGRRHKLHPLLPGTVAHQVQHHVDLTPVQHQLKPAKRRFPVFDIPA